MFYLIYNPKHGGGFIARKKKRENDTANFEGLRLSRQKKYVKIFEKTNEDYREWNIHISKTYVLVCG